MASGAEHYREAERLADLAAEAPHVDDVEIAAYQWRSMEWVQRQAQAHATLALAAATAHSPSGLSDGPTATDWRLALTGDRT